MDCKSMSKNGNDDEEQGFSPILLYAAQSEAIAYVLEEETVISCSGPLSHGSVPTVASTTGNSTKHDPSSLQRSEYYIRDHQTPGAHRMAGVMHSGHNHDEELNDRISMHDRVDTIVAGGTVTGAVTVVDDMHESVVLSVPNAEVVVSHDERMLFVDDCRTFVEAEAVTAADDKKRMISLLLRDCHARLAFLLVVLTIAGLVLGLVLGLHGAKASETIPTLAPPRDTSPSENDSFINMLLSKFYDTASLAPSSPQARALAWRSLSGSQSLEAFGLALLYYSLSGDTLWTESEGWLTNSSVCEWFTTGVHDSCQNGTFVHLSLKNNSLKGTVPREIFAFTRLRTIDLSENEISGTFPVEVGQVPDFVGVSKAFIILDVADNNISGSLPASLGDLQTLEMIDTSGNSLSRSLPTELARLTKLTFLGVGPSLHTGMLPTEYGQHDKLQQMYFSDSQISGSIPMEFSHLTSLLFFDGANNAMTGTIPDFFGNWTNIVGIDLDANLLSGSLPASISECASTLEILRLEDNQLNQTIPSEFGLLTKLKELVLNANRLTGYIPSQLGLLSDLSRLSLEGNQLEGSLPEEICNLMVNRSLVLLRVDCSIVCSCCPSCVDGDTDNLFHFKNA
jgi:Leucine-rich repeat (LRR) protein